MSDTIKKPTPLSVRLSQAERDHLLIRAGGETLTSPDTDGLRLSDIAILVGLSQMALEAKIGAGMFPEPARHAHHRGTRLWDPEAVAAWMAHRDAASAPAAAEDTSPGIPAPDASETPVGRLGGQLAGEKAPAVASAAPTPEPAPRPSYAPALANALMGGCSLLAIFASV